MAEPDTLEQSIYNRVLKHKARKEEWHVTREMVVLGLLHFWKLDRAKQIQNSSAGRNISAAKLMNIQNSFTEAMSDQWYRQATEELDAIKPKFFYGVMQSIVGSFLWSLIFFIVGIIWVSSVDPGLSKRIFDAIFPATNATNIVSDGKKAG